jgi:hypothetical protein
MARTSKHFHEVAKILTKEARVTGNILGLYGAEIEEILIKKTLRLVAKKTFGAGIKKAVKHYFVQFIKGIPGIFFEGMKAFVLTMVKEVLALKEAKSNLPQFQSYLKSDDFRLIIIHASNAMAIAMVNKLFDNLVGDRVNRFFINLLKSAKSSSDRLKGMLTGFLSKKIISLFTKDLVDKIIGDVAEAYEEYLQKKGSFEELLLMKINQKLKEDIIDRIKNWTSEGVENLSKDFIEIFEKY